MPVPASPSGGNAGMPGSRSPSGSRRPAPSGVRLPASSPARSTFGNRSRSFQGKLIGHQILEGIQHFPVIVKGLGVNGEHAHGVPDAQHLKPGQLPVDIAGQGGEEADVLHMGVAVQRD